MKQILYLVIACTILFTSCTNDVAGTSHVFTNPLDPVTAEETGSRGLVNTLEVPATSFVQDVNRIVQVVTR